MDERLFNLGYVKDNTIVDGKYFIPANAVPKIMAWLPHGKGNIINMPLPSIAQMFFFESLKCIQQVTNLIADGKLQKDKKTKDAEGKPVYYYKGLTDEIILDYWMNLITSIVLAVACIESYINLEISNIADFPIKIEQESYTEDQIIYKGLEFKITKVLPKLQSSNAIIYRADKVYQVISQLVKYRNRVVHAKYKDVRDSKNNRKWLWTSLKPMSMSSRKLAPAINPPEVVKSFFKVLCIDKQYIPEWLN